MIDCNNTMTDDQKKAPARIIKNQGVKPCGCRFVEFSDETADVTPCPPCGILEAARALSAAANALGAVAHRLRQDHSQAQMMDAVSKATKKPTIIQP